MASPAQQPRGIKVVWAQDLKGRKPAQEWFEGLDDDQKGRLEKTFRLLEVNGVHIGVDKLKSLQKKDKSHRGLWELKTDRFVRLLGTFRPGGQFVAAWGVIKRRDFLDEGDMLAAQRIIQQHDIATSASGALVAERTPKANPEFKPSLPPPPQLRVVPRPAPSAAEVATFKKIPNEFVWAYVQQSDLLVPGSPKALSLCRVPSIHSVLMKEELQPFLTERLNNLPMEARIALGLVEVDPSQLLLAAMWGIELLMCREAIKQPELEIVECPVPAPEVEEPLVEEAAPVPPTTLYWLTVPHKTAGKARWIAEVVKPVRGHSSQKAPMVKCRVYKARSKAWSDLLTKPAHIFKDLVSLKDPLAIEALQRRPND